MPTQPFQVTPAMLELAAAKLGEALGTFTLFQRESEACGYEENELTDVISSLESIMEDVTYALEQYGCYDDRNTDEFMNSVICEERDRIVDGPESDSLATA